MGKDFLAVADACGVESFAIRAYSFGGIIGRYLVAQSNHGIRMVIIGFHYRWGDEYFVIESSNPAIAGWDGAVMSHVKYLYELAKP